MRKIIFLTQIFLFLLVNPVYAEKVEKIIVSGNERISTETIIVFGEINLNEDLNENKLNIILKKLYETNFFEDVKVNLTNNTLNILVSENPIIQSIEIKGIKAKKLRDPILESLNLKKNNSFTEFVAKKDRNLILNILKNSGFYFAEVKLKKIDNANKSVTLIYEVELGERAKIKKIKFIGDKKFKNRKLFRIIASEENKFWKFISDKKLLNQGRINLDKKLLEGFYKNKGYYNVKVESSFAQLLDNGKFDLIFNINAGEKFFFNDLILNIPTDYDRNNFVKIDSIFEKLKNKPYSYNNIEKILKEVELIALNTEYESINATIEETILENNKINFSIFIDEIEKQYVERINITGNNITREDVLRNKLILDEGDAFNKILHAKSINELRALNFFKTVDVEVVEGSTKNSKIINIEVEEKPTGEISAGAGFGTSGSTVGFAIKENNFLGKGVQFSTNIELSDESIRGMFSVANPNFRGADQSVFTTIQSSETNRLADYGYKTTKTGFTLGSRFEYYEKVFLSPSVTTYYESLKVDSTASSTLEKQKGTYFDTDLNYLIDYDKRNQKFQTTDGFRSRFSQSIPIVSETNAIINGYEFNHYKEILDEMVTTVSIYGKSVNSLTGDNVRISERLYMPTSKLRGFQRGKVGPVDSNDYVGGNYVSSLNIAATLPNVVPNWQNADFSIFLDAGNVWGVDYSSTINNTNKLRSAAGVALDWHTPVGPLSFSYTGVISKASTDKTEAFRFNLGTTF
jgi:outer membrane protein insertion porin family